VNLLTLTAAFVPLLFPHDPRDGSAAHEHGNSILAVGASTVTLSLPNGSTTVIPLHQLAQDTRSKALALRQRAEALNSGTSAQQAGVPQDGPWQAEPFRAFAPQVTTRSDAQWLYVESDGLPHAPLEFTMMKGIRTWQQQVPLPQAYRGSNAWQIPLTPKLAAKPVDGKEFLRRGAIALAVNGLPIFNALNNRGEDAFAIGELDEFGGHCGRADDYHYHAAPLALAKVVGDKAPIAFALDGFPIYGLYDPKAKKGAPGACPDGGVGPLDEWNGHESEVPAHRGLGGTTRSYHYHATTTYPYINGGMRGEVKVEEDQIVPQPRAEPLRPSLTALRGAAITAFERTGERAWKLTYELADKAHRVEYSVDATGKAHFEFFAPDGSKRVEDYAAGTRGEGRRGEPRGEPKGEPRGEGRRGEPRGDPRREGGGAPPPPPPKTPPAASKLALASAGLSAAGQLDVRYTCDGDGVAPPFEWTAPPEGTTSVALTIHHVPPEGGEHVYLVLWGLAPNVRSLAAAQKSLGVFGINTVNRRPEYAPPCSQGPGEKLYTATLFALREEPKLSKSSAVTRAELLAAIAETTLATASLDLRYSRQGPAESGRGQGRAQGGQGGQGGRGGNAGGNGGNGGNGGRGGGGGGGGGGQREAEAFRTEIPAHLFNSLLTRVTSNSVTLSLQASEALDAHVTYTRLGKSDELRTKPVRCEKGLVVAIELDGLDPNTEYRYTLHTQRATDEKPQAAAERGFVTQRKPGTPFTFAIQADSHLDSNVDPQHYVRTLENIVADRPDFLVDLGDTFMTDKYPRFRDSAAQYEAQRYYFGLACQSAPLFMVLGNHDGEYGHGAGKGGILEWSYQMRVERFPPPRIAEGGIFSGRTSNEGGQSSNYYAFEWGDALLVVLDPFSYTTARPRGENKVLGDDAWSRTLGREQYDWLARTLASSKATHRFVFIHHLVGGLGKDARGGAESAPFFEWGGKNADGSDGFEQHRPGWGKPVHTLLREHKVQAVFHGHDHIFVHSEFEGVTYQCLPQPGNPQGGTRSAEDYGYRSGTILGSPGYLRVHVAPESAKVEFVRSNALAADGGRNRARLEPNGTVMHSYTLAPRE
jgi:phosphatidylethanolamine-binding protein (PEBP) family uncharacterized protein/predicted phosphodiesterase